MTVTTTCGPGQTEVAGRCVSQSVPGVAPTITCTTGRTEVAGRCVLTSVAGVVVTITCGPGQTEVAGRCVDQSVPGVAPDATGDRIPRVSSGSLVCPRFSEGSAMICELGDRIAATAAAITEGCVAAADVFTDDGQRLVAVGAAIEPRARCEVRVTATMPGSPAVAVVVAFFTTLAREVGAFIPTPTTTTTTPAAPTTVHDTAEIWATTAQCSTAHRLAVVPVTVRPTISGVEHVRLGATVLQSGYCSPSGGGIYLLWDRLTTEGTYSPRGSGLLPSTATCLDDATPAAQPSLSATWRLRWVHLDSTAAEAATVTGCVRGAVRQYATLTVQVEAIVTVAPAGTVSVTWRCPATSPAAGTNPVTECSETRPAPEVTGPTRDRTIEGLAMNGTAPAGVVYEDGFTVHGAMAALAADQTGCRVVFVAAIGPTTDYVLRVVSDDPAVVLCTVVAADERVDVRVRFTVEWSWSYALTRLARCWAYPDDDQDQPDDNDDRSLLDRARGIIADLPIVSGLIWAVEAVACMIWRYFTPSSAGMSSLVFHSRYSECESIGAPLTADATGAEAVRCQQVALLTWWMPLLSERPYDCRGPNVDVGAMLAPAATIQPTDANGQRVAFFTAAELQPLSGHHISTCVGTTLGGAVSPLRPVLTPIVLLMALAVMWLSIAAIPSIFSADPTKVA